MLTEIAEVTKKERNFQPSTDHADLTSVANTGRDCGNTCNGVTRKSSDALSIFSLLSDSWRSHSFPWKTMEDAAILTEVGLTVTWHKHITTAEQQSWTFLVSVFQEPLCCTCAAYLHCFVLR